MEEDLEICVPVFGLSMLGYLATRIGWFSEQSTEGLARFVFDWAVPMLLFRLFSTQSLPAQFSWRRGDRTLFGSDLRTYASAVLDQ